MRRHDGAPELQPSTSVREVYVLQYVAAIRRGARMPMMIARALSHERRHAEAAPAAGDTDVIGLAHPLCIGPDAPRRLPARRIDALPGHERKRGVLPAFAGDVARELGRATRLRR